MQKRFVIACIVSVVGSSMWAATPVTSTAQMYKTRCANCHGDKADGVSKVGKRDQGTVSKMAGSGVVSAKNENYYGSPLNHLSGDELFEKLQDLRKQDFDAKSPHSAMRENLKVIEKRNGKVSDRDMATYIYETFGAGASK